MKQVFGNFQVIVPSLEQTVNHIVVRGRMGVYFRWSDVGGEVAI